MDNNLNIIIVTLVKQGLPSSLYYCVCSLHTHHTHDLKTLSAFYFHAKRTVGSRVPWRISPTVIDLKTEQNRTKQNKTKQKQTNKKTFAVRSLLGQTGKILFLCMNNFSSKSCMSLYKLRLFLRSMFNIKNYYIINIILLIISNDPVLENVQHKVTELNPHRHAYPGITEVCKPWSWA